MLKSNNKLPIISLVLHTFNGGEGVRKCLESVKKQKYPKEFIELVVIDNGSKDNSVEIAKEYVKKVHISYNDPYKNRADSMRMTKGEFIFMVLEQDLELRGEYFLKKMIQPLLENKDIAASFTRNCPRKDQPWVTRLISYNPLQCDPLYEFLTVPLEKTIIKKVKDYFLCKFEPGKIPPSGRMLYRKSALKKSKVWKQERDFDDETLVKLVNDGYNLFAYVPSAGIYHGHARSLQELISKRIRNLNTHYFPYNKSTQFTWADFNSKRDTLRLILWVLYTNLIIFPIIKSFFKFIKNRDWVFLMEPIVAISVTDAVLWTFMTNNVGRNLILNSLRSLFINEEP